MLEISLILLLSALLLALFRSIRGPGLYNRLLATNHFSLQSVMFIAIYGFYTERPDFLDIAIMYVLIGFVGAIAVLKYHEYRYLGDGGSTNLPDGWRAFPDAAPAKPRVFDATKQPIPATGTARPPAPNTTGQQPIPATATSQQPATATATTSQPAPNTAAKQPAPATATTSQPAPNTATTLSGSATATAKQTAHNTGVAQPPASDAATDQSPAPNSTDSVPADKDA